MAEAPPLIALPPQQVRAFSPDLHEHIRHSYGGISGLLIALGVTGIALSWYGSAGAYRQNSRQPTFYGLL